MSSVCYHYGKHLSGSLEKNLRHVFHRIRAAGLKLQPNKCAFCQKKVSFLGYIISQAGIVTDLRKTEKVISWPLPTTKPEVQQFLGLANYYCRFIKNLSKIAKPLHKLTEKNASFLWTAECQLAFDNLIDVCTCLGTSRL